MNTTLPAYLRQYEVAELLKRNKKVVQRAAERGQLTPIKDGHDVYYRREEVVELLELRNQK
jgi:hypothetical protein